MADVQPLHALTYDLTGTGGLQPVVAPPYDVIGPEQRRRLMARSPYNVVRVDLPKVGEGGAGTEGTSSAAAAAEDPYAAAAAVFRGWRSDGVLSADAEPALWVLAQDFVGPDGISRTRRGFLARVRIEDYGAGRIRPHERTHPGPKEDRLRLTRATQTNLSPIFSLYSDPDRRAWSALEPVTEDIEWGISEDDDGTVSRVWRVSDPDVIELVCGALAETELLIADGHHRYETARVYADEVGGEGPHRYVLMYLVALQDPGLTVYPTHRLVRGLDPSRRERLAQAIRRDFEIHTLDDAGPPVPRAFTDGRVRIGYLDGASPRGSMLVLRDEQIAADALPGRAKPYHRLDTAVLEALVLKRALGLSDEDIDKLNGLGYARDDAEAVALVADGSYDAAFFMGATPVQQIQAVAGAGESMPPKSTYFFPKVPTGVVFNPLV